MNRLTLKFAIVFCWMFLLVSCQKDQSIGHNPVYSDITSNDAPYVYTPNDGIYKFVVATVTTYQNFNTPVFFCSPDNGYQVSTITNSNNNRIINVTVGVIPINAWAIPLAIYQGDTLNYSPCYGGPVFLGPSNNLSMNAPISWAFKLADTSHWTFIDSGTIPIVADIVCPDTISTASGFTIQTSGQMSGDSMVFSIGGKAKVLPPTANSCTFSASEMTTLIKTPHANIKTGENASLVQVTAYTLFSHSFNGQKCYFVKEATFSKYVCLR